MTSTTESSPFILPIRVYYEDTDAGGIVYHSTYLNFMERARTEWLLSRGVNLHTYADTEKKMFVVRNISINYHKPAVLCDDLYVATTIAKRTKTRVHFEQIIYRGEERLTSGMVEIVCLDTDTRKPLPFPGIFTN